MGVPATGGNGAAGMAPADILAAYQIPASSASGGRIVAILDSPDSSALSDLNVYRNNYGIAPMAQCSGNPTGTSTCFAQVNETGGPSSGQDSGTSDGETSLDMDMVSAACPDCSLLLVELNGLTDSDVQTGVATAISLGASAISISIGGPEGTSSCQNASADPVSGYTTPGHLVLAASGDTAYELGNQGCSSPAYPSSAPTTLAVGGTNLFNTGSGYDEAVWNDGNFGQGATGEDVTTSGCSTEFPAPAWQATALAGTGCSKRATAALCRRNVHFCGAARGHRGVRRRPRRLAAPEGTSVATPLVAGLLTRLGPHPRDLGGSSWPYNHTSAFNDVGSASSFPVDANGSDTDAPEEQPMRCPLHGGRGLGRPDRALERRTVRHCRSWLSRRVPDHRAAGPPPGRVARAVRAGAPDAQPMAG